MNLEALSIRLTEKFSADATRLSLADAGGEFEDGNFDE
jgi:hypothetical protein